MLLHLFVWTQHDDFHVLCGHLCDYSLETFSWKENAWRTRGNKAVNVCFCEYGKWIKTKWNSKPSAINTYNMCTLVRQSRRQLGLCSSCGSSCCCRHGFLCRNSKFIHSSIVRVNVITFTFVNYFRWPRTSQYLTVNVHAQNANIRYSNCNRTAHVSLKSESIFIIDREQSR